MKEICVIVIRNSKGEFFVNQRADWKKTFPGFYAIGAGGHKEDGETPEQGAIRELQEETKLEVKPNFLFALELPEMSQIDHVFEIQTDEPFDGDASEWKWWGWLSSEELDKIWKENKLCPDNTKYYEKYREIKGIQ